MTKPEPPTHDEIDRVVSNLVVRRRVKENSGPHVVADCPVCGHREKLYLNTDSGLWDCKYAECSAGERGGNLFKLADVLGIRLREKRLVRSVASVIKVGLRREGVTPPTPIKGAAVDAAAAKLWNANDAHGLVVLAYLRRRGLDDDAIRHFKLGVAYVVTDTGRHPAVGIPYMTGRDCVLVKMRNVAPDCAKGDRFRRTKGGDSALWNIDGVRGRRRVVLVEGELDGVSLWQCGITEVASTSLGAKKDIPEVWKEALSDADDVVLWYDDDEVGHAAIEALSAVFGSHRVRVASIPQALADDVQARTGKRPKDVNDLVRAGVGAEGVRAIVSDAKPLEVGALNHLSVYQDAIVGLIEQGQASIGEPTGFASLDALILGWRQGEVTYLTGHTGQGKSSLGTYLGDELAKRGVPVLLSAFEDGPLAIAQKAFRRRFGRSIATLKTEEDKADALAAVPLLARDPIYVIDAYGRVAWQDVVDAITYAAFRLGVKWVLLDHLHFFARSQGMESVEHLDKLAMDLAALAVKLSIHIAVIVHPNGKIEEVVIPTGDSLKGSSSLKQCASNGITVFRLKDPTGTASPGKVKLRDASGRRMEIDLASNEVLVYVWKKRHPDAREGMTVFTFDGRRTSYHERESARDVSSSSPQDRAAGDDPFLDGPSSDPDLFGGTQ